MLGVGVAFYYDLNIIVSSEGLCEVLCPYYVKEPHESSFALRDVWFYLSNLSSVNRF